MSTLINLVKKYGHGGSLENRADELEENILSSYDPDMTKDLPTYLENFHRWAEELTALQGPIYDDDWYKRALLRNLQLLQGSQATWVTKCDNDDDKDFTATVDYLRKKALRHK